MGELKQHQPPMTIDEQVENLKNIGLIVEDEECMKIKLRLSRLWNCIFLMQTSVK